MARKKNTKEKKIENHQRIMEGIVVNIIDPRTIKVEVERKFAHPLYEKTVAEHKTYLVDNKDFDITTLEIGDLVKIGECKPVSKRKSWELKELIKEEE